MAVNRMLILNQIKSQHDSDGYRLNSNSLVLIITSVMATLLVVFLLVMPAMLQISPVQFVKLLANKELPGLVAKLVVESNKLATWELQKQKPHVITPLERSSTILTETQRVFSIVLLPSQSQSLKLFMEQDYDLDYRWRTDGSAIEAKLTGHPQSATEQKEKVFGAITADKSNGFFIAPFTGTYEWRWENKTKQTVTVRFTGKGAFRPMG